ncbi:MAG: hypothetical protein KKC25_01500, partial [Proteobacteria bacterium]|nr:hypothetical protein [Pseudomonadota bacterium]
FFLSAPQSTKIQDPIYNVSAPACAMREIVGDIADALGKYPFPVRVPVRVDSIIEGMLAKENTGGYG